MTEQEKAAALESAVVNSSSEETAKIYKSLGNIEFTARALGLACRFCGLDMVKVLIENGATFQFAHTEDIERDYKCYAGDVNPEHGSYHISNFSLMLLTFNTKALSGSYTVKGINMKNSYSADDGKKLKLLPESERAEIIKYLFQYKEHIEFDPEELLYYAILANDFNTADTLKGIGVSLSESRLSMLTENANSEGWTQYCSITRKMTADELFLALNKLSDEIGENNIFNFTKVLLEKNKDKFYTKKGFEILLTRFDQKKMNKTEMMCTVIKQDQSELLSIAEQHGWIKTRQIRDKLIECAQSLKSTECIAWLLDFKNRTADLEAERAADEKKMERELNAKPDSVYIMKQIWSYKKRENGTLIITNYKGTATEVTVPETIGKNTVTAIGDGAFAGRSIYNGVRYSAQQLEAGQKLTKVTLPKTIKLIGSWVFADCVSLKEMIIPLSVEEIGDHAFYHCTQLENVGDVCRANTIGTMAFEACTSLKKLKFTNITKIPERAFNQCFSLETLVLPETVELIENTNTRGAFYKCDKLTVMVKKGSYTEDFCKKYRINFAYSA